MGTGSFFRSFSVLALSLALALPMPVSASAQTAPDQAIPQLLLEQLSAARGDQARLLATARLLSTQYPAYQMGIALELLALTAEGQILAATTADAPALINQALAAGDRRGLFRSGLDRRAFVERLRQTATTRRFAADRAGTTLAQPLGPRDPERQGADDEAEGDTGGGLDFGTIQSMPWYPAALLVSGLALGGTSVALANETDNAERAAAETPAPTDIPDGNTRVIRRAPPPTPSEPGNFETISEPFRQSGIAQINALPSQRNGIDGSGVIVSVADSGIDTDHPDLAANLLNGRDLLSGDFDENPSGQGPFRSHGTAVAGIIAAAADGFGIQGIAPAARILPLRVGDSVGQIFLDDNDYVDELISAGVDIANNSFGGAFDSTDERNLDPYERGVENGIIFVWAAGNDNLDEPSPESLAPVDEPDLLAGWVTVVAVDENNSLAPFSNQCGAAAAWCIAAPGVDITTTVDGEDDVFDTLYGQLSGTSFAAPHVAGALAVLKQNFPSTPNAQLLQILFQTATELDDDLDDETDETDDMTGGDDDMGGDDMGDGMGDEPEEPPVSPIFGHGLINLEAALQPQGVMMAVAGEGTSAPPPLVLEGAGLNAGPAFGDALGRGSDDITILGLDSFNRAFDVPLSGMTANAPTAGLSTARLHDFGRPFAMSRPLDIGGYGIRFALETRKSLPLAATAVDRRKTGGRADGQIGLAGLAEDRIERLAADIQLGAGTRLSLRAGPEASTLLETPDSVGFFNPAILSNPYLRFGDDDIAFGLQWGSWQVAATANTLPQDDGAGSAAQDPLDPAQRDRQLGVSLSRTFSAPLPGHARLRLTGGATLEQNRLLGLNGRAALAPEGTGRTLFLGGQAQITLIAADAADAGENPAAFDLRLVGQGYVARSRLDSAARTVSVGIERLITRSWSLGLIGRNALTRGDRWHIMLSRPLRAQSGRLTLARPFAMTDDAAIISAIDSIDLEPTGRTLDGEIGYGLTTPGGIDVTAVLAISDQPGHSIDRAPTAAGLMRLQHRF